MRSGMRAPVGFARPSGGDRPGSYRVVALEVVASAALALSTLVAATVITIGYARADTLNAVVSSDHGRFWLALLLSVLFASTGGLTALMASERKRP